VDLNDRLALLNACLNACSFVALVTGWFLIRAGRREAHRAAMSAALVISTLFLLSYGVRIGLHGTHPYPEGAPGRGAYLVLLASHVLLAATVPFFAFRGVYLAIRGRLEEHRRLMRLGLPVWLYVSVTGVLVYLVLYGALGRLPA
jgi:putative membrane protein